ncbi:MAG: restriction endonuclease [Chloroherpetonaceae bacterium]
MVDYNFNCLTYSDFEDLSRDIIQKENRIRLECFSPGRDSGIDFRYIGTTNSKIIVQCKHYLKSSYSKFINELKTIEVEKAHKLNPDRYILATSQSLTPQNKDEIKSIFNPYIKSTEDIIGIDDFHNLLRIHEEIAKKNYKLWFSSTAVLERIVHSAVFIQSTLEIENLENTVKIFVKNQAYYRIKKKLREDNFCIILGNPGIGKTTIAKYLMAQYLERGFDIISCNTIEDALKVYDPNKKQFFYYDDFLGQSTFGDKLTKNEDQRILTFLGSVKKAKTTKFLLTTRKYILHQAQIAYEKLNAEEIEFGQYTIELSDYTQYERARILYNHLWYSNLDEKSIEDIIKNRYYLDIINHKNFTPRLINTLTSATQYDSKKNYAEYFFENLANPKKIWEHAFSNQISEASRNLIITLNSLPKDTDFDHVEKAFHSYHSFRARKYSQSIKSTDFKVAIRETDGSFIRINPTKKLNRYSIDFENPSIHDFINLYLKQNLDLFSDIFETNIYFQQNVILWNLFEFSSQSQQLLLSQCSDKIIDSIIRTFKNDLKEYDQWHYYYKKWVTGILDYSFENRLGFLLGLSKSIKNKRFDTFISELLSSLITIINKNQVESLDLFTLLEKIFSMDNNEYRFSVTKRDIFLAAKQMFFDNLDDLDSFEDLINLTKISQFQLTTDEERDIKIKFQEKFQSSPSLYQIDQDEFVPSFTPNINEQLHNEYIFEVESFLQQLEEFAVFFNVNLECEINALQTKINNYHEKWNPDEDFDFDLYRDQQAQEQEQAEMRNTESAIDDLFIDWDYQKTN